MSDRLQQGLAVSRRELEAGVAEAQAELERLRQMCRETEELIANAKVLLLAGRATQALQQARRDTPSSRGERPEGTTAVPPTTPDFAAGLRARLQDQARETTSEERDSEGG